MRDSPFEPIYRNTLADDWDNPWPDRDCCPRTRAVPRIGCGPWTGLEHAVEELSGAVMWELQHGLDELGVSLGSEGAECPRQCLTKNVATVETVVSSNRIEVPGTNDPHYAVTPRLASSDCM